MSGRRSRPRVLTVVGNRPQFIKAAAVSLPLRERAEEVLVHSGQHYDPELSDVFFEELGLAPPDLNLAIGSGGHAEQTAATMVGLESLLDEDPAAAVVVYGDTNTTLGAALAAAKQRIPVVHIEAGMRSFNRSMPEEVNRVAVDHLSDLLLCPTEAAMENVAAEGLGGRAALVGDVMADVAADFGPLAERRSGALDSLGVAPREYLLATLHRAANVDDSESLRAAVDLLLAAAERQGPLLFPAHPRTHARLLEAGELSRLEDSAAIRLLKPLGYLDFAALVRGARAILTDSGGLQKEAYLAGVPCLTLREETEWVETVESGWNQLIGLDPMAAEAALVELAEGEARTPRPPLFGDGHAGERCASEVAALLGA